MGKLEFLSINKSFRQVRKDYQKLLFKNTLNDLYYLIKENLIFEFEL